MNRQIEKQLTARAVELGNRGDASAVDELAGLLQAPSMHVRRLAVSALGKLAGAGDAQKVVNTLLPILKDHHPQVRQYAIKALSAYGTDAACALNDLTDIQNNPTEKEYNHRDAKKAIGVIQEACELANSQQKQYCQRCNVEVDADEYARSMRAFDRVFCDRCFDETYLRRRNFDTKVELQKTIPIRDGQLVQSHGERIIADFLHTNSIEYRYDERIRIVQGFAIRPDFYLPEFDVYIEYWGMNTTDYKIGMLKKKKLYQQEGKKLISLTFRDKPQLAEILRRKLGRYCNLGE